MSTRCIRLALVGPTVGTMFLLGCGSSGPEVIPIRGEVVYNGAPLKDVPQGLVHYYPTTASGRQASGRIQPDGSFVLTTFKRADGVVPGDYNITVSAYTRQADLTREQVEARAGAGIMPPRLMIPEKYIDPNTSGISDTVDSDHSGFKRIELTD